MIDRLISSFFPTITIEIDERIARCFEIRTAVTGAIRLAGAVEVDFLYLTARNIY